MRKSPPTEAARGVSCKGRAGDLVAPRGARRPKVPLRTTGGVACRIKRRMLEHALSNDEIFLQPLG